MKQSLMRVFNVAAVLMVLSMIVGCGGGGGSNPVAINPSASPGNGLVQAKVSFQGTQAYRAFMARAANQTSGIVTVEIIITGNYSEDGEEFSVKTTVDIDTAVGYAKVSLVEVPVGSNHLMTATADFGNGLVQTIMAIIPAVAEGVTTQATADEESTVVAKAAILYAAEKGVPLSEVETSVINTIAVLVHDLGPDMYDVDPATLVDSIGVSSITVSPASVTMSGKSQQFTATASGADGTAITGAVFAWSVDPATLGYFESQGLFIALEPGSGTITASVGDAAGTAQVTVECVPTCETNADCNIGVDTTVEEFACLNPGACDSMCVSGDFYGTCNNDGVCDFDSPNFESPDLCPDDCTGDCDGDGICDPMEHPVACPEECSPTGVPCGDGFCQYEAPDSETPQTCALDCDGSCNGNSLCEPNEEPATCSDCMFCADVTTMDECTINPSCAWTGTECVAVDHTDYCTAIVVESECLAESGCAWDTIGGCYEVGYVSSCDYDSICDYQDPDYESPAFCSDCSGQCNADGTCDPDEDPVACPADCSPTGTACGNGYCEFMNPDLAEDAASCALDCDGTCNNNGYCDRNEEPSTCSECMFCDDRMDEASCNEDMACMWDGTSCIYMDMYDHCTTYTTETDCLTDTACNWDAVDGCHTPDYMSSCDNDGVCEIYDPDYESPYSCSDCSGMCNGNGTCDPDEDALNCPVDCSPTGLACGNLVCQFYDAVPEDPSKCPTDCDGACDNDYMCDMNEEPGTCGDCLSCEDRTTQTDCESAMECAWDGTACAKVSACGDYFCDIDENMDSCPGDCMECGAIMDQTLCGSDSSCQWVLYGDIYTCVTITGGCNNDTFCDIGEDTSCGDCASCGDIADSYTCMNDPACDWSDPACLEASVPAVCGDSACTSGENMDMCPTDCTSCAVILDATDCGNDMSCSWSGSACIDGGECNSNSTCDGQENISNCPYDCYYCSDIKDATACDNMGECVFDGTYCTDAPPACNYDSFCDVDENTGCSDCASCADVTTDYACNDDLACAWTGTACIDTGCGNGICESGEDTSTCISDCVTCSLIMDSTDCDSDPSCIFDGVACITDPGTICGDASCDSGENIDSCPSDCSVCSDIFDSTDCDSDSSCYWDGSSCVTNSAPTCGDASCDSGETMDTCPVDCTACADILDSVDCNNDTSCNWNGTTCLDGGECVMDTSCGAGENMMNCSADCMACADITDSTSCDNDPMCMFDGTSCVDDIACSYDSVCDSGENTTCSDCATCSAITDSADCYNDINCFFDGVSCLDQVTCLDNSICASGEDTSCTDCTSCADITDGSYCANDPACSWDGSTCTSAGPVCGDSYCDSGEETTSCPSDCLVCSYVMDSVDCSNDTNCVWDGTMCQDAGYCGNGVCESGEETTSCFTDCPNCSDVFDSADCTTDVACSWDGSSCVMATSCNNDTVCDAGEDTTCGDCLTCSTIIDESSCWGDSTCLWDGMGMTCVDGIVCVDDSVCSSGEDTSCADCATCADITDSTYCNFDSACFFGMSSCLDAPSCTDNSVCEVGEDISCTDCTACADLPDESYCWFSEGCIWSTSCIDDPCLAYTDQTNCELNTCIWEAAKCAPDYSICPGLGDQSTCEADVNCLWNAGGSYCEADESISGCDQFSATDQTTCESNTCIWEANLCYTDLPAY